MRIITRLARWGFIAGVAFYCVCITCLSVLWWLAPMGQWWIALSNVFAAPLFLPLVVVLPIALALRSRWLIGLSAVPAIIFVVLFGSLFMPRARSAVAVGHNIRVATFNQLYQERQVEEMFAAIGRQHADIVALQELTPPVAEMIQRDLAADYPYQLLAPSEGSGGMGLLSRYPFTPLDTVSGRSMPIVVDFEGQAITVVNVHIHFSGIGRVRSQQMFGLPYFRMYDMAGRKDQVESLVQDLAPIAGPLIVMGDFNTGDREPGYGVMAAEFRDAFRETSTGFGFTFPNNKKMGPVTIPVPLVRIDYIWTRGPLVPLQSYVDCNNGGSDHCMVAADLLLTAP